MKKLMLIIVMSFFSLSVFAASSCTAAGVTYSGGDTRCSGAGFEGSMSGYEVVCNMGHWTRTNNSNSGCTNEGGGVINTHLSKGIKPQAHAKSK